MAELPLTCPRCALAYPLDERFCQRCGMPLVYAGGGEQEPITDQRERARKIKPQYARGDLVRVAGGRNQPEAELMQGILLEEGVPSILRRSAGFDVPDFLAAGPRDVMVPESGYEHARQMLVDSDMLAVPAAVEPGAGAALRLLAGLLAAVGVAAAIVWVGVRLAS